MSLLDLLHIHHWSVIHHHKLESGKGGFKHQSCDCGKQRVKEYVSFNASQEDRNELGFALSLYSGFQDRESE